MATMPSAPRRFSFRPRPTCICGGPLGATSVERRVPQPWGDVIFKSCEACGSWCQSPEIEPASLAAWYDSDSYQGSSQQSGGAYQNYAADEAARLLEARERFTRDIAPFLPHGGSAILEIGCASGSLLVAAREAGHVVTGVDLSPRFAEQARSCNGIDVRVGDFLTLPWPVSAFDAVLMFGTASNLSNLPEVLRKIRRLLRPDGRLFLNFPPCDTWVARWYGQRFWMFAPSANTFSSIRGMRQCATGSGWIVEAESMDRQRPSWAKLLKHARLTSIIPRGLRALLSSDLVPFRVPIPAVHLLRLRPAPRSL